METLTIIDTTKKDQIRNGYGYCTISGCGCGAFRDVTGTFPNCANSACGHSFSDHY